MGKSDMSDEDFSWIAGIGSMSEEKEEMTKMIKKRIEQLLVEKDVIEEDILLARKELAEVSCPFKVGQVVIDSLIEDKYKVTRITFGDEYNRFGYTMYGRPIKKSGLVLKGEVNLLPYDRLELVE